MNARFPSLLLALAVPLAPAAAQMATEAQSPVSLADTLALPTASSLTGSTSAPRFAWVENKAGVRNLWVADPKDMRRVTARTADDGVPLSEPVLNAAGTMLAYVEGGDPEFPDLPRPNAGVATTTPAQTVHLVRLDADAPVDHMLGEGHSPSFSPKGDRIAFSAEGSLLIASTAEADRPAERVATMRGTLRELRWSPDGTRLAFSLRRDNHAIIGLYDLEQRALRYLDPGFEDDIDPCFSPDGRQIAFFRVLSPPPGTADHAGTFWGIRIADVASGSVRTIWSAPKGEGSRYSGTRSRNLYWSADGHLIFPWERDGWLHIYALPATGSGAPRLLTPGAGEVETFLLAPGNRDMLFAGNMGDIDRRHLWRVPVAGGSPRALTGGKSIESFPTFAGDRLAVIATDARRPAQPMLVGPHGLAPMATGAATPPPETRDYVMPEQVMFRAADGVEVHGQLFKAHGSAARGRRPALLFIHGGPRRQMLLGFHQSGYYSNAYAMNQYLAARGYTVLAVNYRSGTGYGRAFREAADTGRGGASEYRDILAAGRYLAGRADVDPARIGLWGGSWGGYLTALGLARDSDLFAAGADLHGVHDMVRPGAPGLSPQQVDEARRLAWQSSPIAAIDGWRSPILLIHGDDDRNVDFAQSVLLARLLKARDIPHETLAFPNERHGFLRYSAWLAAYRAIDDFFARTLAKEEAR